MLIQKNWKRIALFLIAGGLEAGSLGAAPSVEWSNVSSAGNGCPAGSAEITMTPNGEEVSMVADAFGFDLSGPSSVSRFCRLSASVKAGGDYYLLEIKQEISYGGIKSKTGSRFSIGAQGRFFGYPLAPILREYGDGISFNKHRVILSRRQNFSSLAPISTFCNGSASSGLFQGTVASTAQVLNESGEVSVGIQGQTVSYKAKFSWLPCPG